MATTAANKAVAGMQKKVASLTAGVNKDLTAKNSLTVIGNPMTQPQILTQLASIAALYTNVDDAKANLKQQEAARMAALPTATAFVEALIAALKSQFGVRNPQLEDFGIGIPRPRPQRTAEQKAISAAKARQTRAAHGIMGKRQRAAITVAGSPGLTLVGPSGVAQPGLTTKPTPPADLSGMPAPVIPTAPNGSTASGSTPAAAGSSAAPAQGTGSAPGKGGSPVGG